MIYRKFKINEKFYAPLSKEDKEVVKVLEEVVRDAAEVYKQQLEDGFYPKGVNKERVEATEVKGVFDHQYLTYLD